MEPRVNELSEKDGLLTFTLTGVDVSVANALRRTLLSDIPIVVFRTFPYEENKANISINTTRLNNEIIKQRISCIPIYINDLTFSVDQYEIEIDVKNDTDEIIYVTTEDIKVKNITNEKYITKEEKVRMFPPDLLTGDYIDLVRLRPNLNPEGEGEQLKLTCGFSIGIAKENSMFNVVTTCSYGYSPDKIKLNDIWNEVESTFEGKTKEEVIFLKRDFEIIEGQRNYIPNSFDFIIESNKIYTNYELIGLSIKIINQKLDTVLQQLANNSIKPVTDSMDNCFELLLENEDYTIGKLIEKGLYYAYFENEKVLKYVSFKKLHPHDENSYIKFAFIDIDDSKVAANYITSVCKSLQETLNKVKNEIIR